MAFKDLFKGLSEKQVDAIKAIDEDVEIIACAGAGKTGVVTRRIINILKEKEDILPENIVAFTFTEKAAEELKTRIYKYGKEILGNTNGFAQMYVGTIHGFCLKMLQEYIPEFQKFTVLNEIRTKLFIQKNYDNCGMSDLMCNNQQLHKYKDTGLFLKAMSLLNENLFEKSKWDPDTVQAVEKYRKAFYQKKYFDYSLIMQEMLSQLEKNKEFADIVLSKIKYLTVDEYQDINPIQERLIQKIKTGGCNLCIVGDDDQTIYEFRGSDPSNILTFKERYNINKYIVLDINYRSSQAVIDIASSVIKNNRNRLEKQMQCGGLVKSEDGDTIYKTFNNINEETEFIAERIKELHSSGVRYSEIAVLLRKHKFGADFAQTFQKHNIPFIIEGVNKLFDTLECKAAKGIFEYLNEDITESDLLDLWTKINYKLDIKEISDAIDMLSGVKPRTKKFYGEFCLQSVYHDFLRKISIIGTPSTDSDIILYNLGKFSQVIDDFETVYYATIPEHKLSAFCSFLKYSAEKAYPEGYLANTYIRPDAVNVMTVHQSKGLEFTAVFIPQLNKNNFPSRKMGGRNIWHIIDKSYIVNADRIAGDNDVARLEGERKLFYVAMTRAKKYLLLTRSPYNRQEQNPSSFLVEAEDSRYMCAYDSEMKYTNKNLPPMDDDPAPINLNFSILQDYFECAYRFKLSMFYGFVQPIVPAIGYGKSMHEIVQNIHRRYIAGETLTDDDIHKIVDTSFYLPYANTTLKESMKTGADRTALEYFRKNEPDFKNITMAEADIELDMGNAVRVNGRIDLVKRKDVKGNTKTFIVDFKTKNREVKDCISQEQLKIYALGYLKLKGEKADYVEIYNLDHMLSEQQCVTDSLLKDVEDNIRNAADKIRKNDLPRKCCKEKCQSCYLNYLCLSKDEKTNFEL